LLFSREITTEIVICFAANVTVEFHSAADLELAMGRNKSFIGELRSKE
jgi:hypothetical protein